MPIDYLGGSSFNQNPVTLVNHERDSNGFTALQPVGLESTNHDFLDESKIYLTWDGLNEDFSLCEVKEGSL